MSVTGLSGNQIKQISYQLQEEQNILDARYLVVNRLASKCIQRHGLGSLGHVGRYKASKTRLWQRQLLRGQRLKSGRKKAGSLKEGRIF